MFLCIYKSLLVYHTMTKDDGDTLLHKLSQTLLISDTAFITELVDHLIGLELIISIKVLATPDQIG